MASKTNPKQIQLSTNIKNVHKKLRIQARKLGAGEPTIPKSNLFKIASDISEEAWNQHLQDEETLNSYATNMRELSENYWKPNLAGKTEESRVTFTVQFCELYFQENQIQDYRNKELEVIEKINKESQENIFVRIEPDQYLTYSDKLKLLDVGSSFNPFLSFEQTFDITALDLSPANETVLKCDFLKVSIEGSEVLSSANQLHSLPADYFEVIIFSLLLEYLPVSDQRIICCEKSYQLLKKEGILVILTPDSKHQGANAKLMKNWRFTLALMGFQRIKISKLKNLTCLVFRKCLAKEVSIRWAKKYKESYMTYSLNIPQDKNLENDDSEEDCDKISKVEVDSELFEELPGYLE